MERLVDMQQSDEPRPNSSKLPSVNTCVTRLAVIGLCASFVSGCNQGGNAQPAWPWPTSTSQSPWGTGLETAPGMSTAQISELQKRADEQAQLAAAQQQRIEQLRALSLQSNDQVEDMRQQQLDARQLAIQKQQERSEEMARRAREALDRYGDLDGRARGLDRNNRDLHSQLAQSEQRSQLLEDQNQLLRQRLEETSNQLAEAFQQTSQAKDKYQALNASMTRRSGASITANNSYRAQLTAVTISGLSVRQDGELVRIELPSDDIFEPGTARLRPEASEKIELVADVVLRHYPRQVIGIEAHADANQSRPGSASAHQLTAAQAVAVVEALSQRHQLLPSQLFVLGHGANFPLVSNGTNFGQSQNRRVEVVVYPETVDQR